MPRLSFVVPVYKTEKYLPKCIRHLQEQSLTDWEAVFVLDGPSPEAEGIIRGYNDPRFKVLEVPHGGACAARNHGYDHTSPDSDIIIFWDSDTYIEPDASKNWVEIFDANSHIGFIYSGYKFVNEGGVYPSEDWDPWLLKVRNFISTMNPLRRKFVKRWDESLKSLQDWDFWLSVVEDGAVPMRLNGEAWSTEMSRAGSISGENCKADVWMDRVNTVKAKHNLPKRDMCVASILHKSDAIALAKLIDADYQDNPEMHPHDYKCIIQVGFGFQHGIVEHHARIFSNPNTAKYLFWTNENITELWNAVNLSAMDKYGILLNNACHRMFCEDLTAQRLLKRAGFECEILPMPIKTDAKIPDMPKDATRFLVDACEQYGYVLAALERNMPDVELEVLNGPVDMSRYTGLIHLHLDKTMSANVKRALLMGRHVISNIGSPFCGFIDDNTTPNDFMQTICKKMRSLHDAKINEAGMNYYKGLLNAEAFLKSIKPVEAKQEVAA